MREFSEEEVQDLTDRVFLAKEQLEAGKVFFAEHLIEDFARSFEAIRLRADGKVDPHTVDSRIRAFTLGLVAMRQRNDAKKSISLGDIQAAYFDFLFSQFGHLYEPMVKAGGTPAQAAHLMAKDAALVESFVKGIPELAGILREFWKSVGDAAAYHLQDGTQLKATFAGDLFPSYWENAVSTAGLYVDTIVLPCPISRIAPLANVLSPQEFVRMLVKHTFTAMGYRDLATADVTPPLAVVVPDPNDIEDDGRSTLVEQCEPLTCKHAQYLFGRDFDSVEHFKEFCSSLPTVDKVLAELRGKERLVFDTEWGTDAKAQLERAMKEQLFPNLDPTVAGHHVLKACVGRMPQAVAAQRNAQHFGGTPLINAETSWLYYTWMLEYEGAPSFDDEKHRTTMHVVRALVSETGNNLDWLGNVPPEAVLKIRQQGLADEVRAILSHGVSDLIGINPNNYFRTADQVVENIEQAFRAHQKSIAEAKLKKLKLFGIDVPQCLASGGLAVAAALTGNVTLGVVSGIVGSAGFANIKDIKSKWSTLMAEDRARRLSPTGLLFRHVHR